MNQCDFIDLLIYFQAIQEAIDVFQRKNETFKLASKEMDVEVSVSCRIGILSPAAETHGSCSCTDVCCMTVKR